MKLKPCNFLKTRLFTSKKRFRNKNYSYIRELIVIEAFSIELLEIIKTYHDFKI